MPKKSKNKNTRPMKTEKLTKLVKTTKPIKKAISKAINSSKERKGAVRTEKIDYPKN